MSCEYIAKPSKCEGHRNTIKAILKEFHTRANFLIKRIEHKNLVRYVACRGALDDHFLRIYLAQEFVEGESIRSICENGQLLNISAVGKEV